jgi:hypothetical protein
MHTIRRLRADRPLDGSPGQPQHQPEAHGRQHGNSCAICHQVLTVAKKVWLTSRRALVPPCDHFDVSFITGLNLASRIGYHTGERPHKCDICHVALGTASVLARKFASHRINICFSLLTSADH